MNVHCLLPVGIALGSNMGDRMANLVKARDMLLEMCADPTDFMQSALYETEPMGCPVGSQPYYNAVVQICWAGSAEDLLLRCQMLERMLGRDRTSLKNEPRTADVDIIYIGQRLIRTPRLCIPHPRACSRKFVLLPLADIRPDYFFPGQTQTVSDLAAHLHTNEPTPKLVSKEW